MARLVATSPAAGLLPVTAGAVTLSEEVPEAITSVAPYRGKAKAVSEALKADFGAGFPAPNRTTGRSGARIVWNGPGQAMALGPRVSPEDAAVTDQSDAWACLVLEGTHAAAVLARLVPVDLREAAFKRGHAARTLLGHMTCTLMRTGALRYEILVFRSMAATAVHELAVAMRSVAARS